MIQHLPRIALTAAAVITLQTAAMGQPGLVNMQIPPVPDNLQAPAGNVPFLKVHAIGTQNYICLPGAAGPVWTFLGPQATLFTTVPWMQGSIHMQTGTHFLSANPGEAGTARPTWQSSFDTSAVWGKAAASSTDPQFVAPGAIPWLLVQVTGARTGPTGGSSLTRTTYIQRVNTAGGSAPSTGCGDSTIGKVALVPYATDYFFYASSAKGN